MIMVVRPAVLPREPLGLRRARLISEHDLLCLLAKFSSPQPFPDDNTDSHSASQHGCCGAAAVTTSELDEHQCVINLVEWLQRFHDSKRFPNHLHR